MYKEKLIKQKKSYLKRIANIKANLGGMWNHEKGFWMKQIDAYEEEIKRINMELEGIK